MRTLSQIAHLIACIAQVSSTFFRYADYRFGHRLAFSQSLICSWLEPNLSKTPDVHLFRHAISPTAGNNLLISVRGGRYSHSRGHSPEIHRRLSDRPHCRHHFHRGDCGRVFVHPAVVVPLGLRDLVR